MFWENYVKLLIQNRFRKRNFCPKSNNIDAEIETIDGRIDAVIKTENNIFIIEFKANQSAEKAIQQIKTKKYALKYANDKREIIMLGINFDTEKKQIEDWKLEKY